MSHQLTKNCSQWDHNKLIIIQHYIFRIIINVLWTESSTVKHIRDRDKEDKWEYNTIFILFWSEKLLPLYLRGDKVFHLLDKVCVCMYSKYIYIYVFDMSQI